MQHSIHDRAAGKWRSILSQLLKLNDVTLSGKHTACPMCGGKDRWRFDDKGGKGTWICTNCKAGTGVDLVMRMLDLPFIEAVKRIEEYLPSAVFVAPRAKRSVSQDKLRQWWSNARRLDGDDPASRYLAARKVAIDPWPSQLRYMPVCTYQHEDGSRTEHPAMLAQFLSPDTSSIVLHITYLTADGHKASVPTVRKMAKAPVPKGGAVRLASSAETMGIAEGIETALSAMILHDVPVWAALNTNNLIAWEPPSHVRHILVFGDSDESLAGQYAAYALGYRLRQSGHRAEVRIPDDMPCDWNDVLVSTGVAA